MADTPYKYEVGDLGVGQTLDVAGNILRNRFWDLAKICLFFFVPAYLLTNLATYFIFPEGSPVEVMQNLFNKLENPELLMRQQRSMNPGGQFLSMMISFLQVLVVLPITRGAVCRLVAYEYLGREQKAHQAFSWAIRKRFWRLLLSNLLFFLILMAVSMVMGFGFLLVFASGMLMKLGIAGQVIGGLLILVLVVGLLLFYVYIYLRFCLYLPPIVVEDCAAGKSIGRSSALVKGRMSRFFWVLSVTWIISVFVVGAAWGIPGGWVTMVMVSIVAAIPEVFGCCVQVVFYFNCRCVHENLDIVVLSESVKALASPQPEHRTSGEGGSSVGTEYV